MDFSFIILLLGAGGLLYYSMLQRGNPPPITCPTGYQLVNGTCTPIITSCPTGYQLVTGTCVPIVPAATSIIDNFDSGTFVLNEGALTPNGQWVGTWPSGGILQQKKMAGSTTDGVMEIGPRVATQPSETFSSLVLSVKDFTNFDMSFQMRTTAQLRTGSPPNTWETAWIMWRFTDPWHVYYFMIKNSGLEYGKKDNAPGNNAPEEQIFLATPAYPPLVIGRWYNIRILAQGTHCQIWVDGAKVIDHVDPQLNYPSMITHGVIGLYCEDSRVEYNNFNVVAIP